MRLIGLLLLVMVTGCVAPVPYVDVSAGAPFMGTRDTDETPFVGEGPIVRIAVGLERDYTERLKGYCEYQHLLNLLSGRPFNDDEETTVNTAGCGLRYKFR